MLWLIYFISEWLNSTKEVQHGTFSVKFNKQQNLQHVRHVTNFNSIRYFKTNPAWIWNLQFDSIWVKTFQFSNLKLWYLYKDVYEHNLKQLPGPLQHLCTSVTLICSKVYCPHHVHLHSSLFFSSSISSIHPTTKSRDDPSVPLFLWPSPPSGCFLFQNPLRVKTPSSRDG